MAVGVHAPHDLRHVAVGVDHERRARVRVLALLRDAVGLAQRVLGVGQQRERQLVLRLELLVRGDGVGADAEHLRARALELAPGVADAAGLARAAGRVVLGIEVEDDRLAAQLGEPDGLAAVGLELEVRSRLAFFDHAGTLATLKRVKRAWNDMNPTVRGFLIIGLIAIVVVALQLQATVFSLLLLARIAFFLAIAYFIFLVWRDRRQEFWRWASRSRIVFYGSAVLLVVNVAIRFWEPIG